MALFDQLIAPILDSATKIIGEFHASPADQEAAREKLIALQQNAVQQAQDYETKLNDIAGQNIRADATNADKFTSRARPTFMYIVEAVLAFNYIGIPLAGIFGSKYAPIVLPGDLLTLFGVCITGYVMSRGAEKVAQMPGDSQVSIGPIKIANKN